MASQDTDESAPEFLRRMDAGHFDGRLSQELKNLSKGELEKVAQLLVEREAQRKTSQRGRGSP